MKRGIGRDGAERKKKEKLRRNPAGRQKKAPRDPCFSKPSSLTLPRGEWGEKKKNGEKKEGVRGGDDGLQGSQIEYALVKKRKVSPRGIALPATPNTKRSKPWKKRAERREEITDHDKEKKDPK